jgi:Na+/H+-translocating membrane pyrophosphatase
MKHRYSWIGWVPAAAVGVVITAVYVSWFTAYSQLGRRPMPSADDPKFIGGWSTSVTNAMTWVILVSLVIWAIGMITNLVISILARTEDKTNWMFKTVSGMIALLLLLVLARFSPGDACVWIVD